MGAEVSKLEHGSRSYSQDVFSLISGQRFLSDRVETMNTKSSISRSIPRNLVAAEYQADWSVLYNSEEAPQPRKYQCSCYSKEKDILFVAYGQSSKGDYLNDCWVLDFSTMKWTKLANELLSPRAGANCVIIDNTALIFGGEYQGNYYTDFHAVNLDSGELKQIETSGISPEARSGGVMGEWKRKIFIWGGFNVKILNDMFILNLENYEWSRVDIHYLGRAAPAYCVIDNFIWIYGSTRNQGLIRLDMETKQLEAIDTSGKTPPMDNQSAAIVNFGDYLLYFGGKCEPDTYSLVYAYSISRSFWFSLHVRPDSDSLTVSDGVVNEDGQFLLPNEMGFSALYRERNRTVYSIFGSFCKDPLPIYLLYVGNALAFLNHQSDMLAIFSFSS